MLTCAGAISERDGAPLRRHRKQKRPRATSATMPPMAAPAIAATGVADDAPACTVVRVGVGCVGLLVDVVDVDVDVDVDVEVLWIVV